MVGNFNHDTTLYLFIIMQYNFHKIVVVLPEVIHPLNSNMVLRTIVDLGSADDNLD